MKQTQRARERLAKTVLTLRQQQRMSQQDLAEEAGITRTEVYFIEKAKKDVQLSTLMGLRRAFNVTWSLLLTGVS